jgi:NAD(P)-dependent dehydrogenase (short-subunit alcohol dehydrogenase family)
MTEAAGRLAGKVAVITGAASGMGRATVMRFLGEGAAVVGLDLNADHGDDLTAVVKDGGFDAEFMFVVGDVSEEQDVESTISSAVDSFGHVDVMFNNAGIGGAFGPIVETDVEFWEETFAVNMRGVFLGTKHAARQMIRQGDGGAIVSTASVAGLGGGSGAPAYSAAKAGVVNFTKNAALELARHRIRVNAICPGLVFTPLMHRGRIDQAVDMVPRVQPWPDRGEPEDIASAALFLASDDSAFVTGESLVVDGGYSVKGGIAEEPLLGTQTRSVVGVNYGTTGQRAVVRDVSEN